jgi:hypothetical protein
MLDGLIVLVNCIGYSSSDPMGLQDFSQTFPVTQITGYRETPKASIIRGF